MSVERYDDTRAAPSVARQFVSGGKAFALVIAFVCAVTFLFITQRGNWSKLGILVDHPILMALTDGLATFGLALTAAYGIEFYFVGWERSSLRMLLKWDKQIRYDLFFALLPWTSIYALISYYMTFGTSAVDFPWMAQFKDAFPIAGIAFFPLQLVVVEIVSTLLQYCQHRCLHHFPVLWETHKFHHSVGQMTTLSLMRETPFTAALNNALIAIPTALVGVYLFPAAPTLIDKAALAFYVVYTAFNQFNQFLIHSNLNVSYGWFGRYFIVSPANHRVHHSILLEHRDKNFSVSLVLWDRVFGTYHEGTDPLSQNCPVGYEGNIYNKSKWVVIEYLYPTFAFFVAIYARLTRHSRYFGHTQDDAR